MHYLENPAVHIPIFRSIFGEYAISANEEKAKQQEFDSLHQKQVAELNPKLEYLINNDVERDLDQNINGYIQSILAFYSTL